MEKINIGTYSFGRDGNMTLLDKLKAAKELGYTGIEFLADDMQYSAEELKGWLDEAGVEAVSLHAAMDYKENVRHWRQDDNLPWSSLLRQGRGYRPCKASR